MDLIADAELEAVEQELDLYEKGRILKAVSPDAWGIIFDTIREYAEAATRDLKKLTPGDPAVPAAHAAWYALQDFAEKFPQDIQSAANAAANPSPQLRKYVNGVRESLDVLKMQMESK